MDELSRRPAPDRWLLLEANDWHFVQAQAEDDSGYLGLRLRLQLVRPLRASESAESALKAMLSEAEGLVYIVADGFSDEIQESIASALDTALHERVRLRPHRGIVDDLLDDLCAPDYRAYRRWVQGTAEGPLGVRGAQWSDADAEAFERAFERWTAHALDDEGLLPLQVDPEPVAFVIGQLGSPSEAAPAELAAELSKRSTVKSRSIAARAALSWTSFAAALRRIFGWRVPPGTAISANSGHGRVVTFALISGALNVGMLLVIGITLYGTFGTRSELSSAIPSYRGGHGADPVYVLKLHLLDSAQIGPLTEVLASKGALLCGPLPNMADGGETAGVEAAAPSAQQRSYIVIPKHRSDREDIRTLIASWSQHVAYEERPVFPCLNPQITQ